MAAKIRSARERWMGAYSFEHYCCQSWWGRVRLPAALRRWPCYGLSEGQISFSAEWQFKVKKVKQRFETLMWLLVSSSLPMAERWPVELSRGQSSYLIPAPESYDVGCSVLLGSRTLRLPGCYGITSFQIQKKCGFSKRLSATPSPQWLLLTNEPVPTFQGRANQQRHPRTHIGRRAWPSSLGAMW
jgi:hypothetical protein